MSFGLFISLVTLTLVAAAIWFTWEDRKKKTYRRLSSYREDLGGGGTPLGMEATDLDLVSQVTRRNDSLERAYGPRMTGHTTTPHAGPNRKREKINLKKPQAPNRQDDPGYARWFHKAFNSKGNNR